MDSPQEKEETKATKEGWIIPGKLYCRAGSGSVEIEYLDGNVTFNVGLSVVEAERLKSALEISIPRASKWEFGN